MQQYLGINIDLERDSLLTDFALTTLKDRYMLAEETSPQHSFARASVAFCGGDLELAQRIYDYASKLWMGFSTPVLSNGGTDKGLPISCMGTYVPDSRRGLLDHYEEIAYMSSSGSGIGSCFSDVRSYYSDVRKSGKSSGVIAFMKPDESFMQAFSQAGTRRGSEAIYIDIDHPEIEEFIEMRKPTGGDPSRKFLSKSMHHAVNISDKFMEAVEQGLDWDLIDPNTKAVVKTVEARYLWQKMLETRVETGEPYCSFIDTTNRAVPQFHKDLGLFVKHSNLCCVSGSTMILTDQGEVEIGSNVDRVFNVWNGQEYSGVVFKKTKENAETVKVTLANDSNLVCTLNHRFITKLDCKKKPIFVEAKDLVIGDIVPVVDAFGEMSFTNVVSIEPADTQDVYCFNEPLEGTGVFNGILTGQSEIVLPANAERTFVCCLSSVNLEYFEEWKSTAMVQDLITFLDNVLDVFIEQAPPELAKSVFSAKQERSLGLGAMGFHSFLQSKGVAFDSALAESWNRKMFKFIRDEAELATHELGQLRGNFADYEEWKFQEDKRFAPDSAPDRRNAYLIAVAPTATNSIIVGCSPSVEPIAANIFTHKTDSGSFLVRNKNLNELLQFKMAATTIIKDNGDWDETKVAEAESKLAEVWKSILEHEGSVQHLDLLSADEKEVYKTAIELDQSWIVHHASVRQQWIDQAQSINLFFRSDVHKKYLHKVHMEAWKKGLKTLYYCRTVTPHRADNLSASVERNYIINNEDDGDCKSCQ